MEDISRELEKEIAQSKPKPYKQDRKRRVIIVDDFGQMKSGEYLKTFLTIMSIISVVCFVAAVLFFYLYTGLFQDIKSIKNRLVSAENKVDALTRDKEVLMARLVISGKEPGIEGIEGKAEKEKQNLSVLNPPEPENGDKADKSSMVEQENSVMEPESDMINESPEPPEIPAKSEPSKIIKKIVSIERFTVTRDGANGDILVRFDIRNISSKSGDISGRIFTVLKPDNLLEDQWLVVPSAALKNGIPSEYKKGQYFSITHFKPVKFRIQKSQVDPDFFKKASIFIFNEQADLMFEQLIDITEAG